MNNIFHRLKPKRAPVLAFFLALVMVIGIIPFTATEAHAMTVDATSGGITWENGDSFTLHLFNQDDPTKTETHTVTYDGTAWSRPKSSILPANAFAYIGTGVTVTSHTEYSVTLAADQSTNADVMIAMGTVTKDSVLNLNFSHCFAKLTFNITMASEFDSIADITGVKVHTKDTNTPNVTANIDGDTVTALVTSGVYTAGDELMEITVTDVVEPLKVKVPAGGLTFEDGTNYEFDLKVGKNKVEITQVSTSGDWSDGDGWNDEINLDGSDVTIGTADAGKTGWAANDQVVATLTSEKYGTQTATLTYDGTKWIFPDGTKFSYPENETPTITAVYAPSATAGLSEYIVASAFIAEGQIKVDFTDFTRTYSRLRIAGEASTEYTVAVTNFTPSGATEEGEHTYTVTTDASGNAYLYGTFAAGATITVKLGDTEIIAYTFTTATEAEKSYALKTV